MLCVYCAVILFYSVHEHSHKHTPTKALHIHGVLCYSMCDALKLKTSAGHIPLSHSQLKAPNPSGMYYRYKEKAFWFGAKKVVCSPTI